MFRTFLSEKCSCQDREALNIESTVNQGLCTGCGTCVSVCAEHAITLSLNKPAGLYRPVVDRRYCKLCMKCHAACPGHGMDFGKLNRDFGATNRSDPTLGTFVRCYSGYACDSEIRYKSSSGGIVTALLGYFMDRGLIDGALVVRMRDDRPWEPEPFIAKSKADLSSACGSKYCPVPLGSGIRELLQSDGRFAVVGLPCHIHGIRKAASIIPVLKEKLVLSIGLFCGHTDTFHAIEYVLRNHDIPIDRVVKLTYRGNGWPGNLVITMKDGSFKLIPYRNFIEYHEQYFFTPKRCLMCCDSINRLCDVTVMDAWLPQIIKSETNGISLILTRSHQAESLCQEAQADAVVVLDNRDHKEIIQSHGILRIGNSDLRAHFYVARLLGESIPKYDITVPLPTSVNFIRAFMMRLNTSLTANSSLIKCAKALIECELSIFRWFKRTAQYAKW